MSDEWIHLECQQCELIFKLSVHCEHDKCPKCGEPFESLKKAILKRRANQNKTTTNKVDERTRSPETILEE
jgi:hypothetical protein